MAMTRNVMIGLLALTLFTTAANAGVGVGLDLRSPLFAGDPRLEDCLDDQGRLTMDARGIAVRMIKYALKQLGYDLGPNANNDLYDFALWEAVRAFKKKERLGFTEYGDVGPKTMEKLDQIFAPIGPSAERRAEPAPSSNFLDRAEHALPLIIKPGPRRRMTCVVEKLRAGGSSIYFDFHAARRVPGAGGMPRFQTDAQRDAAIASITRFARKDLQSVVRGATSDADVAHGMAAIDDNIGRNINDFQSQMVGDSATAAWMRLFNADIGARQLVESTVLSCYATYGRRNHDL